MIDGCICATVIELSAKETVRVLSVCKILSIYYPVLYRKSVLTSATASLFQTFLAMIHSKHTLQGDLVDT